MNASIQHIDVYEIAVRVAPHMGGDWQAVKRDGDHYANLRRLGDGAGLYMNVDHKGKLGIGCEWPKYANGESWQLSYNVSSPSIAVAALRDAKTIAAEIKRRLLPVYLPMFEKAYSDVQRTNSHHARQETLARRVAAAIGGSVYEQSGKSVGARSEIKDGIDAIHNLHVSGDKVYFEVNGLPEELAVKILLMLKEAEPIKTEDES